MRPVEWWNSNWWLLPTGPVYLFGLCHLFAIQEDRCLRFALSCSSGETRTRQKRRERRALEGRVDWGFWLFHFGEHQKACYESHTLAIVLPAHFYRSSTMALTPIRCQAHRKRTEVNLEGVGELRWKAWRVTPLNQSICWGDFHRKPPSGRLVEVHCR